MLAAVIDLSHPGRYIHWGWFQMSLANLIVIAVMITIFVLAIVVSFPKGRRR